MAFVMKILKLSILIFSLLFPLIMGSSVFGQQATALTKNVTISAIANEQTHELAKEVVRTAYKKVGVEVEFNDLPGRRGLEWANLGKTDGDLARIAGTEKKFTNLIKISTPITEFKGVVFTKKSKRNFRSWEDLKGLSIGIIGGIRYSDIGTKGLNRIVAKDMPHLFKLLSKERIDVAIAVLDAGKIEIHRNFKNSKIHVVGQPLFSAPLFHFINKKNKNLISQLELAFQKMKESGEIEAIRKKALQEALSQ